MIQVSFQYVLTGFVGGVFFVEQVVQPVVGKVGVLIQYPIYALVILSRTDIWMPALCIISVKVI